MSLRNVSILAASGVAVASIALLVPVAGSSASDGGASAQHARSSEQISVTRDQCSLDATAPTASAFVFDKGSPVTAERAVALAGGAAQTPPTEIAVAQLPYGSVGELPPSVIDPTRCVWAVTVHATYTPNQPPLRSGQVLTLDRYTVVTDVATGSYLQLSGQSDGANVG